MKIKERNRFRKEKVYKIIATEDDLKEWGTELAEQIVNEYFKTESVKAGLSTSSRMTSSPKLNIGYISYRKLGRIKTIIQDNMDFFIPEDPDLAKEITNAIYKELTIENLI